MHSMHLFSLKRLCGGLKVRVEQIWWEICDQGPRVPQRRIPLGGCFIDLPSYRPLGRSRFCCHKKYRHCMIFRHLTGFLRHTINRVLSRLQIRASGLRLDLHAKKCWTLPPDTKAFLYYFTSWDRPRIAGELRIRIVPSDDPATFESGSDFLRSNGRPWLRSLYVLSKRYIPLYEKLREEGFVPDDLDEILSTFPPGVPRSQPLYTLDDIFIIDFSIRTKAFTIITEQSVETLPFDDLFYDSRFKGLPYTGAYTNHLDWWF